MHWKVHLQEKRWNRFLFLQTKMQIWNWLPRSFMGISYNKIKLQFLFCRLLITNSSRMLWIKEFHMCTNKMWIDCIECYCTIRIGINKSRIKWSEIHNNFNWCNQSWQQKIIADCGKIFLTIRRCSYSIADIQIGIWWNHNNANTNIRYIWPTNSCWKIGAQNTWLMTFMINYNY